MGVLKAVKRVYYYFWHDLMKRNEPYTATLRRWVRAHPRLAIGIPIGGFVAWWLLYAHIFELW